MSNKREREKRKLNKLLRNPVHLDCVAILLKLLKMVLGNLMLYTTILKPLYQSDHHRSYLKIICQCRRRSVVNGTSRRVGIVPSILFLYILSALSICLALLVVACRSICFVIIIARATFCRGLDWLDLVVKCVSPQVMLHYGLVRCAPCYFSTSSCSSVLPTLYNP